MLLHGGYVSSAQFSPDGQRIVTASDDGTARVWEAATGKEVAMLRGQEYALTSALYSLDGQRIVTTGCEKLLYVTSTCVVGTARMWNATTGQQLAVLRGHEGRVSSAQFSQDDQRIVTASDDKTARVWNAVTGKELTVLRGHESALTSAQFSSDGKHIMTASADGTIRIYVVEHEDLIALALSRVTRTLTCEERVQYLREDIVCPTPTP